MATSTTCCGEAACDWRRRREEGRDWSKEAPPPEPTCPRPCTCLVAPVLHQPPISSHWTIFSRRPSRLVPTSADMLWGAASYQWFLWLIAWTVFIAMETCVLIPQEFSLVLAPPDRFPKKRGPDVTVTVWTNAKIPQGTLIYPFQGTIRLDKLDVYSYLDDNDVSHLLLLHLIVLRFDSLKFQYFPWLFELSAVFTQINVCFKYTVVVEYSTNISTL